MTSGLRAGLYVASALSETSGFGILAVQERRRRKRALAAQERLRHPNMAWAASGTGYMAAIGLERLEADQVAVDLAGVRWASLSLSLFVLGSVVGLVANVL